MGDRVIVLTQDGDKVRAVVGKWEFSRVYEVAILDKDNAEDDDLISGLFESLGDQPAVLDQIK